MFQDANKVLEIEVQRLLLTNVGICSLCHPGDGTLSRPKLYYPYDLILLDLKPISHIILAEHTVMSYLQD